MTDPITPARLVELAKKHEQNARDLAEYEEANRAAVAWQEQMFTSTSEEETATALRAAAGQLERIHNIAADRYATLAAREALLAKTGKELADYIAADKASMQEWNDTITHLPKWTSAHPAMQRLARFEALAAEIAAALGGGDNA